MKALVLTGGGARAAYQAGVLRGIAEITPGDGCPFPIVTGSSGGALNGLAIAARADDFDAATAALWDTWSDLAVDDVFSTAAPSIARIGAVWMRDLVLGGLIDATSSTHLVDTTPLRALLDERIDFPRIAAQIRAGALHGVAVSTTHYGSGATVTFFDGDGAIGPWQRGERLGRRTQLALCHAMASSAMPLFFPPEPIGDGYYGDGCIRLTAPLSPAVHLGAERLLAIGVRAERTSARAVALVERPMRPLTPADVAGVLLNAVFLDSLDGDVERLERINRTLALMRVETVHPDRLRPIPALALRPSRDLGALAAEHMRHFPATLRYMLRGLGADGERGGDLVSYLAFDGAYTRVLLALGLRDARAQARKIREFLSDASEPVPRFAV